MRELDPGPALSGIATGDDLVSTSLTAPRYLTVLVGMFALAALVLSVVGIYGVMACLVDPAEILRESRFVLQSANDAPMARYC